VCDVGKGEVGVEVRSSHDKAIAKGQVAVNNSRDDRLRVTPSLGLAPVNIQ